MLCCAVGTYRGTERSRLLGCAALACVAIPFGFGITATGGHRCCQTREQLQLSTGGGDVSYITWVHPAGAPSLQQGFKCGRFPCIRMCKPLYLTFVTVSTVTWELMPSTPPLCLALLCTGGALFWWCCWPPYACVLARVQCSAVTLSDQLSVNATGGTSSSHWEHILAVLSHRACQSRRLCFAKSCVSTAPTASCITHDVAGRFAKVALSATECYQAVLPQLTDSYPKPLEESLHLQPVLSSR